MVYKLIDRYTNMKKIKIHLFIAALLISFNLSAAEKDFNLEKEVVGRNSKDYSQDIKVNSNIQNKEVLNEKDLKVKLKEDKLDVQKDLKIKDITVEDSDSTDGLNYNLIINTETPTVIAEKGKERDGTNYMIFALGGYEEIDSFKYIIDYTNEDREKEITYFLHLGREIKGEYRFNSDMGIDNYFGKIWYKNLNISLSHILTEEKLPGNKHSTSSAVSWINGKSTELAAGYDIIKGVQQSLRVSGTAYLKEYSSSSKNTFREYDNRYYNIMLEYEKYLSTGNIKPFKIGVLDNFIDIKGIYYMDNNETPYRGTTTSSAYSFDEDVGVVRLEIKDKIRVKNVEKLDISFGTAAESVNGTAGDESFNDTNISADVKVLKEISDKFEIGLNIEKNNKRKTTKELIENFKVDRDILMPTEVLAENRISAEMYGGYKYKNFYAGERLRLINTEDMIIYYEADQSKSEYSNLLYKDGAPIVINNYEKNKEFTELETTASYSIKRVIFELSYTYSTIENIAFTSKHKAIGSVTYRDTKNEAKLECLGYSDFYTTEKTESKRSGYLTTNAFYTNRINENLDISLRLTNILNRYYEFKTGYEAEPFKAMLEFKINY